MTVPSLAKLNLDLRVIHRRADNYHELRTIFQTISLADQLVIEFEPAKKTRLDLASSLEIEDNLVLRAARETLELLKIEAHVRFSLYKRIPLGAGLGGGSSNAAAVLLALPALAGRPRSLPDLLSVAEALGSDVPFFLHGGTALGIGRGHEVYPLPDQPPRAALVVATGLHVSTPEAYRELACDAANALTSPAESLILREFQTVAWQLANRNPGLSLFQNDFERVVVRQHPPLGKIVRKLRRLGARPAAMTGSGSALFGVFPDASQALAAASHFSSGTAFPVQFVGRRQYRALWRRALGPAAAFSSFAVSRPREEK